MAARPWPTLALLVLALAQHRSPDGSRSRRFLSLARLLPLPHTRNRTRAPALSASPAVSLTPALSSLPSLLSLSTPPPPPPPSVPLPPSGTHLGARS